MKNKIRYGGGVLATLFLAILFCFFSCSNNSSSSSGDSDKDKTDQKIDHSLGEEISEELEVVETDSSGKKNFSTEENDYGIYIKFAIPENTAAYWIMIDGIGKITENYFNDNRTNDDFFYPFLEPNKEYTVRVQFRKANNTDSSGYEIPTANVIIGYFDITAKAGAQSKGEVFLEDFGKVQVEKNGDFKFTKKTAFHNESLLKDEWVMEIGLCEGVSWMYADMRYKWCTSIEIPCKKLGETYNFYTYPRYWGDVTKVDFIAYRPIMYYKYGEKQYRYQWDGYALDTNCKPESELWTKIDISKDADVAKITGTWESKGEYDIDNLNGHYFPAHYAYIDTLEIDATTVKNYVSYAYTKIDGKFTEEDLSLLWGWDLSSDGMTLTTKYEGDEQPLSEYFADYEDKGHMTYVTLQLFDDGKKLRITESWNEDGEENEWYYDYQKQ